MTQISISDKAKAILWLCEEKERLHKQSLEHNLEIEALIDQIKKKSNLHKEILEHMSAIDETIEKIAKRIS